jgi:hypothetical protein
VLDGLFDNASEKLVIFVLNLLTKLENSLRSGQISLCRNNLIAVDILTPKLLDGDLECP